MKARAKARAALAASLGDPAGIGPELFLRLWQTGAPAPFFLTADYDFLAARASDLGLRVPLAPIAAPQEAAALFPRALPVMSAGTAKGVVPGKPSKASGAAAWAALEAAYKAVRSGEAEALVTGPVSKRHLAEAGFSWPGQTDWLAAQSKAEALMMLAAPGLRTALATTHIPLAQVSRELAQLGADGLAAKLATLATALKRDFALPRPRLALAALNPHAGENGLMGDEEAAILVPAAEKARASGLDVAGPLPADTLFIPAMRETYDAVLCLYHDQALIALKTLDFERGVNISLGLPIIRTSPDHGPAFALAAQTREKPPSLTPLFEAMRLASEMAAHRRKIREKE